MTRIDVWSIIDVMSQEEILLGASSDLAMNFSDVIGVGVIENYLIGWVFSFGIVGCGLLIISFITLLFRIFTLSDLYGKVSIASFFVASLGNNSLSSKTPALFLILIAATLLIRIKNLSNQSAKKMASNTRNYSVQKTGVYIKSIPVGKGTPKLNPPSSQDGIPTS
ncbi:hypothetical protein D3C87_1379000 [compost metagenome]